MHLKYRPEIDGLRALAVILVILFHLGFPVLPGGFVGVDVFFVISGFLITSILRKEIHSKSFSFADFYKRRVIRLSPAYLLVLVATTLVSYFVMLPGELVNYLESSVYSSLFLANFYMWDNVGGYFAVNSDAVPLLHLWSLAVEEQFYLFWPISLFIITAIFKRPLIPILCISLLCLAVSEYGANKYPAAAYYLLPTRAFELLIGAILTFIPVLSVGRAPRNLITLGSLSLIMYSAVTYSEAMFFPGLAALIPCLGAAGLLMFTTRRDDWVGCFFANKIVVYIGRLSYPAYLWHWPIISFTLIYQIEIDWLIGMTIFVSTFILSAITFHWIEQPISRLKKLSPPAAIVRLFIIPTGLLLCFAWFGLESDGWPSRVSESINIRNDATLSKPDQVRGRCNEGPITSPLSAADCILGSPDADEASVLLIGDSHANHFSGMIDVLLKDANLRGYDITQSNTPFLPRLRRFYEKNAELIEHEHFIRRNDFLETVIGQGEYEYVVLGGAFTKHLNEGIWFKDAVDKENKKAFYDSMGMAVKLIEGASSTPVILVGNATHKEDLSRCTLNNEQ